MRKRQTDFVGPGTIRLLPRVLKRYCPKRVFLVAGSTSYRASGAETFVGQALSSTNTVLHIARTPLPTIEAISEAMTLFLEEHCDMVVAVGGGKTMDIGKSVSALASQTRGASDYVVANRPMAPRSIPIIAIPTTAGSGSESTHFAVIYVKGKKYSLTHKSLLPDGAIVDPNLMRSLPAHITATSGMDALCQAIESYWSIHATRQSRWYAARALRLAADNLATAVLSPSPESRIAMARAAHFAGEAINITRTTACHAISYPLTSRFGIPHGHAVAVTMPSMFLFNSAVTASDVIHPRGPTFVRRQLRSLARALGAESPEGAARTIEALMQSIGLSTSLSAFGISRQDLNDIVQTGMTPERAGNNPRALTASSLYRILEKLL